MDQINVWWEELADQYEKWANNPPRTWYGYEEYTCERLAGRGWGFYDTTIAAVMMGEVWCWRYGFIPNPAGSVHGPFRQSKRHEFCHWMADTIREYLETGKGPWETD